MTRSTRSTTITRLLEDAGAGAVTSDFFRSASFMAAEGVTHTLVVENDLGRVALPLIVRSVPGTEHRDAVSPYGYPGGRRDGETPHGSEVDLDRVGLLSAFVRDRLDAPTLGGGTVRGTVVQYDPAVDRSLSKSFRRDVRRCHQAGYRVTTLPGAEVDDEGLDGFVSVYTETMRLVGAAPRYFFDSTYLRMSLSEPGSWLVLVHGPDGDVAAGELVVSSDGMLHSYLAGTATAHRSYSPGKTATSNVLDLADTLGLVLNLGGGVSAGDGVEASKHSYGNTVGHFITHELIGDDRAYRELSDGHELASGFFPSYRAPLN